MRAYVLAVLFIFVSGAHLSCAHKETQLCDNITLKEGRLRLGVNEKVLVCGSSKGGEGWRDVPLPQAQYQLKILLQERGYLNPRFSREGNHLDVWSGPRAEFRDLKVNGADGLLKGSKKRKIIGETVTPEKLDEISQWADTELRSKGFACPKVDVKFQAWDGIVHANVEPGPLARVAGIRATGLEALDPSTLNRYMAFQAGDVYDVRDTQLTLARLLSDGLIQSAYFTTACRGDEVDLNLRAAVGEPRLFRFGVGASTEEFPFADIWFKNTKLDTKASSFTSVLHASPKLQSLDVASELYVLPWTKRSYFGPRFRIARKSETFLEEISAKLGADLGRNWDMSKVRLRGRVGPTLNYVNTVQGQGPDDVSFFSWEGSLLAMNHLYEVGARNQFEGWTAGFAYDGQRKGVGSYVNVDRYEFNFKHLWNVGHFAPPFLILGSRLQVTGVDNRSDVRDPNAAKLPSEYRVFLGGDENLRGFGRKVINNNDFGYLTAAYAGFELRVIEEVPYGLEPFVLYDIAKTGGARYTLNDPIFTSWGLGMRWASPFGTLRASAARGEIYQEDRVAGTYPQEWVYFLSFGQEF